MRFLSGQTRAALTHLAALDSAETAPASLERLRAIRSLISQLEADAATLDAVREAENDGASWNEIAKAAGLKAAAAKWRWHGSNEEIAGRQEAGRKRSARPSAIPVDLPGLSVAEFAKQQGVTAQAVYLQISRSKLKAETIELADGRRYKRVFPEGGAEPAVASET